MRADRFELPLRIVVDHPVPGFAMALQQGATAKAVLLPPARRSADAQAFDFAVTVDGALPDGRPRLLGPCVQGPPAGRFVYLCIHGESGPAWTGRAKVPLKDLGWAAIEALKSGERLCAHYNGTGRGGVPACATVRLTRDWAAASG
ncbi:DUF5990 family protein [Asticcacaulis solisilvae]|uniref:DUF5990 family protein n=1 Tax=Asticcacaulis solisilvae TaxID=1217274 RepID=UPI003FD88CC3